jgi:putative selenium metabolism protein SsnA
MTITLTNATLVQLDPPLVSHGAIRVVDGMIDELGPDVTPRAEDELHDCGGAVVMPGLVNGHTHLYSALAAGMPAPPRTPSNFHEILQLIWWRLDRAHNMESIEASGAVGALAAIRCGTTTLIDHHASPECIEGSLDVLERGIRQVGCRGVLCYETTDRNRSDEGAEGIAENLRYIRNCQQNRDGRFAGLVGAHASFTLGDESLAACVDASRQLRVGIHIHVAEDPVDASLTQEKFGTDLLPRLVQHGVLDQPGTILAHGTHFSDADRATVAGYHDRVAMAHNPSSNMNNGVGYAKIVKLSELPMLGTDGIGADLWREARLALFKSNDAGFALPFDAPLRMLGTSARYASQQLGVNLGVLRPQAAADLVVTSYTPATPLSADNLAGHFIYAMGPEFVRDVMVGGQWCLKDGLFTNCDERSIRAQAVEVSRGLHDRMQNF